MNALELDLKITPKQRSLLEVLANPENISLTNAEKAIKAGISVPTFYDCLKNPNFIQALRLRGLSESFCLSIPIVKRMGRDALQGKYMQQKTMLELGGLLTQTPLVNVILNNLTKTGLTEEEIDSKIAQYFAIDATPTPQQVVDVPSKPV